METSNYISIITFFGIIVALLGLFLIGRWIKQIDIWINGHAGEIKVSWELRKLNKQNYIVFNDVRIRHNNSYAQIDHLVVSNYGIFVIETKNYKGWILGYEYAQYWHQVIFRYKHKFYNPIQQNRGHIFALKRLLKEYKDLKFISIIVFTQRATLKTTNVTDVIYIWELLKTINRYDEYCIDDNTKEEIASLLRACK